MGALTLGLMGSFLKYTGDHPDVLTEYMKRWRSAALKVLAETGAWTWPEVVAPRKI